MAGIRYLQINFQSSFSARLSSVIWEQIWNHHWYNVYGQLELKHAGHYWSLYHYYHIVVLGLKIPRFPVAYFPGDHTTLSVLGQANMFQLLPLLCMLQWIRLRNVFYVWEGCGQSVRVHKTWWFMGPDTTVLMLIRGRDWAKDGRTAPHSITDAVLFKYDLSGFVQAGWAYFLMPSFHLHTSCTEYWFLPNGNVL